MLKAAQITFGKNCRKDYVILSPPSKDVPQLGIHSGSFSFLHPRLFKKMKEGWVRKKKKKNDLEMKETKK